MCPPRIALTVVFLLAAIVARADSVLTPLGYWAEGGVGKVIFPSFQVLVTAHDTGSGNQVPFGSPSTESLFIRPARCDYYDGPSCYPSVRWITTDPFPSADGRFDILFQFQSFGGTALDVSDAELQQTRYETNSFFDVFFEIQPPGSTPEIAGEFSLQVNGHVTADGVLSSAGASGLHLDPPFDSGPITVQIPATIPEPGALLMLGTGLLGAAGFIRRKIAG